jgi:hypothetical protein
MNGRKIQEAKHDLRRRLAVMPVAEKPRILDDLREQALDIETMAKKSSGNKDKKRSSQ